MGRKIEKVRKYRKDQSDGLFYEPVSGEPEALCVPCPVCPADIGEWCGSFGDIHKEREKQ